MIFYQTFHLISGCWRLQIHIVNFEIQHILTFLIATWGKATLLSLASCSSTFSGFWPSRLLGCCFLCIWILQLLFSYQFLRSRKGLYSHSSFKKRYVENPQGEKTKHAVTKCAWQVGTLALALERPVLLFPAARCFAGALATFCTCFPLLIRKWTLLSNLQYVAL